MTLVQWTFGIACKETGPCIFITQYQLVYQYLYNKVYIITRRYYISQMFLTKYQRERLLLAYIFIDCNLWLTPVPLSLKIQHGRRRWQEKTMS